MTSPTPLRIAIIEDDYDLLQSTLEYLHIIGYNAWGAGNSTDFYKQLLITPVDMVLIDIGLPGENGLSITKYLSTMLDLDVIIISARGTLEDRLAGFKAGADRYLIKPVNLDELIVNINAMAHHRNLLTNIQVAATTQAEVTVLWQLSKQNWTLTSPSGTVLPLTAREYRLLQILIAASGQTISKRDIADKIIGQRITNSGERLDVLLSRLRKKSSALLNEDLPIKTAHLHGYAFTAPAKCQ